MLPLTRWVVPIGTIAPNETNSCNCSIVPFKTFFIIKQQPEIEIYQNITVFISVISRIQNVLLDPRLY